MAHDHVDVRTRRQMAVWIRVGELDSFAAHEHSTAQVNHRQFDHCMRSLSSSHRYSAARSGFTRGRPAASSSERVVTR